MVASYFFLLVIVVLFSPRTKSKFGGSNVNYCFHLAPCLLVYRTWSTWEGSKLQSLTALSTVLLLVARAAFMLSALASVCLLSKARHKRGVVHWLKLLNVVAREVLSSSQTIWYLDWESQKSLDWESQTDDKGNRRHFFGVAAKACLANAKLHRRLGSRGGLGKFEILRKLAINSQKSSSTNYRRYLTYRSNSTEPDGRGRKRVGC